MKNWLNGLFSEQGTVSMTRVLSLICVLTAVGIALVSVYKAQNLDATVGVVSVFLGAGLGSKVAQKFAEKKSDNEEK
jgi:uncharacterized membrane protein YfcA